MYWKKLILALAGLFLAAGWPRAAQAQTDILDVTLLQANQTVLLGTSDVAFDATISNPSVSDTIYLNSISFTTQSPFLLPIDNTLFNTNAPVSLAPGASTSGFFELFDVPLDPSTPAGTYGLNSFSISGGPDGGTGTAFNDLADTNFIITVVSLTPTPEPSTLLLFGSGLLASWGFLRRKVNLLR